jgi:hypothetical protein
MKKIMCLLVIISFLLPFNSHSQQQYKLRQVRSMMGMKTESTVYVKGMRKRTENNSIMGMAAITEIQQCDLRRTIKINDKKKVYYIEPFAKDDEVIDETEKPAKPVVNNNKPVTTEKGGTIYMYYNITDTGERKKMFAFTARHVWTTQKMKPSPDACTMKDSFIIKTDGWYIDLPEFNCPVSYRPGTTGMPNREKPTCMDKFVTKRSGKGKLGFPLIETTTMIMGNGEAKTTEFKTDLETLEFSTAKLDSSLFTIPKGYTEVKTEEELQDKFDVNAMINQVKTMNNNNGMDQPANNEQKAAGVIRVAVYEPKGEGIAAAELQRYLVSMLSSGKVQGIAVSSEEEAKKFNCDYSLNTDFVRIKQGSKVGGMLKAIKNADPNAASSFTIENALLLKKLGDGSVRLQQKIEGKYEGKIDDAAKRSLEEESQLVLRTIN